MKRLSHEKATKILFANKGLSKYRKGLLHGILSTMKYDNNDKAFSQDLYLIEEEDGTLLQEPVQDINIKLEKF